MAADSEVRRVRRRPGPVARFLRRTRRLLAADPPERATLVVLGLLAVAITTLDQLDNLPEDSLFILQLLPVYLAARWLGPRRLAWFAVWMVANFLVMLTAVNGDVYAILRFVVVFIITGFVLRGAVLRERLGVNGRTGERLLVDLRDRILRQSELPVLPEGWSLDSELRAAGNTQFSGDFVLGRRSVDGRWLDLVVVDVSGKGVGAGSRSLVLNGAMGALLTGRPGADFLSDVNAYLVDQGWEEGFATAVHVRVDVEHGDYSITSAGHPPGVQVTAGEGRWSTLTASGPVLGVVPGVDYEAESGRLAPGEALLLYTDGMVEDRTLNVDDGVRALGDRSVEVLSQGRSDPAARIMRELHRDRAGDDCALVVLRRS